MKANLKAVLIDHDDSFTFNLQHWLFEFTCNVEIINHRQIIEQKFSEFDFIVLSPGPKNPEAYPHIVHWLRQMESQKPIFGVCLGMQLMAIASGGVVTAYNPPVHGKKSKLVSENIFNGLEVARYHSLKCSHLENFKILATSDNLPMWIQHKEKKWLGIQFHPESFLSENTKLLQDHLKGWIQT